MKKMILEKSKNAITLRNRTSIPSLTVPFVLLGVFLVVYITISVFIAPEGDIDFHFSKEKGSINVLSGIFLSMACGFAGVSYFLIGKKINATKIFWLLIALGFAFFALDELLRFHEGLGKLLEKKSLLGPSRFFKNWNDAIVLAYGLVAVIILVYFLPQILRYPWFTEGLVIAFGFYCATTAVDLLVVERTFKSIMVEETFKLFSSSFFAFAMFTGLLGVISVSGHKQIE